MNRSVVLEVNIETASRTGFGRSAVSQTRLLKNAPGAMQKMTMTGFWIINVQTMASLQAYVAGIVIQKKIVGKLNSLDASKHA